mmetsp:Transcript_42435/g.104370  ORF Transcript_42435/g.104370 Transcript_42435/m.104370 type:complete len:119 (-) Transcript_42435:99-455(-)
MVCANLEKYLCRKVVCEVCFEDFGWNWDAAKGCPESYLCSHCTGTCPTRAQCKIYQRVNSKRKSKTELKKEAEQSSAEHTAQHKQPRIPPVEHSLGSLLPSPRAAPVFGEMGELPRLR